MFTEGEISEDAKTTVREFVRLGREVLDGIEDYENYGSSWSSFRPIFRNNLRLAHWSIPNP